MRTSIPVSWWQRTGQFALSMPAQALLYVALWSLIIWLVYCPSTLVKTTHFSGRL
ncbi:MAG: hypothetical protein KME27_16910 [Lyngbya sp. HA4199-MV5]|nr:hypothetical protein [Lyngbya sp. HA4199-MV5]